MSNSGATWWNRDQREPYHHGDVPCPVPCRCPDRGEKYTGVRKNKRPGNHCRKIADGRVDDCHQDDIGRGDGDAEACEKRNAMLARHIRMRSMVNT
jgi:hypothetical protein